MPVKLVKLKMISIRNILIGFFCEASVKYIEEISFPLSPNQVCFLSQDDRSRVPLGVTAANKQCPFLMHLKYRVRLPDHDFVKAPKLKLNTTKHKLKM